MRRRLSAFLCVVLWCFAALSVAAQAENSIAVGETRSAELVAPEADYYRLTITEDNLTELLITLESDAFDVLLEITDSSATALTSANEGGAGTNVWLVWQPPAPGDYLLIVKSADGAGSGAYTLSVNLYSEPEENTIFSMAIGETISAQFPGVDEGDYNPDTLWYVFEVEQGDVLDFEVETTNTVINSWVVVYTLDEEKQIGYSGARVNPALRQLVFSEAGTYKAGVNYITHTANDQPVGAFSLTISYGEPLPQLTAEPQTVVIASSQGHGFGNRVYFVFDVEAGSSYRVQVRLLNVTGGDSYDLFMDARFTTRPIWLCTNDLGSSVYSESPTEMTCAFTAEYSGTAITRLDNFSYPEELTLEVWLETLS